MQAKRRGARPSLVQHLDKEIYQIAKKLADDNEQIHGESPRLSVPVVYERIKRSNSSLNRKSKRLLEDSIERVIEFIKREGSEDSDDLGSIDGEFDGVEISHKDTSNAINQSIVKMWSKDRATQKHSTPNNALQETSTNAAKMQKRLANGEPVPKRKRTTTSIDRSPPTHVSLDDLGGIDDIVRQLERLLVMPLRKPSVFTMTGIQPPRGLLLHGPPGCGKTMIANAFAAEFGVPFISLSAPSVVSGMSGESEKALREHFEEAKRLAPCFLFIDEIDAITPKRESAQREMEKRIVAQLLTCMDDLTLEKTNGKTVIVIAATNRPDSLDPALRRGGRFDKEINMSIPNEPVREKILRALTRKMSISSDLDFAKLAKLTPGFVGADLSDLVSTAGSNAIARSVKNLKEEAAAMEIDEEASSSPAIVELRRLLKVVDDESSEDLALEITNDDCFQALPEIQPSLKREGFATIPDTTWADIGALESIRNDLSNRVVKAILHPEEYARVGITAPTGVLLWGPPGCGKTLLAKAVANESKANFISIKGPELLNKFVGESERAVRQVFVRARSSTPCVVFFDELDALAPKRDDGGSESSARVVNTLLTELDGLGSRQGIYVLAATNRPDIIDPAMIRPGRLETVLYVDVPAKEGRVDILKTAVRSMNIEFNEILANVARDCDGFSGADIASLAREAGLCAIERSGELTPEDFVAARKRVKPSVENPKKYERLRKAWI